MQYPAGTELANIETHGAIVNKIIIILLKKHIMKIMTILNFQGDKGNICRTVPKEQTGQGHAREVDLGECRSGTKIITDGWAAYKKLNTLGFEWDWMNHSKEFVK